MSGGPVLNNKMKVIGIISNGASYKDESENVKPGFIPIERVLELVRNQE